MVNPDSIPVTLTITGSRELKLNGGVILTEDTAGIADTNTR
jgi:hypothetical protein